MKHFLLFILFISIGLNNVLADTFLSKNKEWFNEGPLISFLSEKEAKIWIEKFPYNHLKERNYKKPYQGKIIDAESHPRKRSKKKKKKIKKNAKYDISDFHIVADDAGIAHSIIMHTPNTYSYEGKWDYYFSYVKKHKRVSALCSANVVGMSANPKKYSKKKINKEWKKMLRHFKKGRCYGFGEAGFVHYNKKKKNPPHFKGRQNELDLDLNHPIIDKIFAWVNKNKMPIVIHMEPFHKIKNINRIDEFKKFYKTKCKKFPQATLAIAHTGMMATKDLEEIFEYCKNVVSNWKIGFHWSSFWGFSDLYVTNGFNFKLYEVWAKSFEKYPDRYIFASDQKMGKGAGNDYYKIHYMKIIRDMIGSLEKDVQEKIAWKNAARVYNIKLN